MESGIVVSVLVQVGDRVEEDQPLIEVETDKVTAEVPSEVAGTVGEILVKAGDEISEGAVFIRIEVDGGTDAVKEEPPAPEQDDHPGPIPTVTAEPAPAPPTTRVSNPSSTPAKFRASPLAKKIAREIGVDLADLATDFAGKRISVNDVKAYARRLNQARTGGAALAPLTELPDFEQWGPVEQVPLTGIGLATSKNMTLSWSQIPHAWLQEKADITDLEQKRRDHKTALRDQGISLTITAILVKVVAQALEEFPLFNSSLDLRNKALVHKKYIHIGVATDTERGLLVPVIRDADQLSISGIAAQLGTLSAKAREKKISADELAGATFTISNLGGIGTTGIFPIVNFPQVAILGIAASRQEAVWNGSEFTPRLMMPMTIGFDHRVINGADAARFLVRLKQLLEDWFLWSL